MNPSRRTRTYACRRLLRLQWLVIGSLLLGLATAHASAGRSPVAMVKETTDQLLSALARAPGEPERAFLETVSPQMDLESASRWALGQHWKTMTASQQEQFVASFRAMIAGAYAVAVANYADADVEYLVQGSEVRAGQATVRTRVIRRTGAPLRIDYRLVESVVGWKLFDIRIDGVSLMTSYRSAFDATIARLGIDGLLRLLAERSAGA